MDLFQTNRIVLSFFSEDFEIKWQNLEKLPNSRLYRIRYAKSLQELMRLCDDVNIETNQIFFHRSSLNFRPIIDFYRTNKFHLHTEEFCSQSLKSDLIYWKIDEDLFEKCCLCKYSLLMDQANELKDTIDRFTHDHENKRILAGKVLTFKEKTWFVFEDPNYSCFSKIISFLSILCVITSTSGTVVSTVSGLDHYEYIFNIVELITSLWFNFEYLVRFLSSENKCRFLTVPSSLIDLFSILPFYIKLVLSYAVDLDRSEQEAIGFFKIVRFIRIFKLLKNSSSARAFFYVITKSSLSFYFSIIFINVVLFSSLLFFVESDDKQFDSILTAMWWGIVTSCSIGYGDYVPTTIFGKCIAFMTALIGIVGTSIPTTFMSQSFRRFKRNEYIKNMMFKKETKPRDMEILQDCRISKEMLVKRL